MCIRDSLRPAWIRTRRRMCDSSSVARPIQECSHLPDTPRAHASERGVLAMNFLVFTSTAFQQAVVVA
eukprot:7134803-Alexandrium_andersonii.AAC.1